MTLMYHKHAFVCYVGHLSSHNLFFAQSHSAPTVLELRSKKSET